MSNKTIVFEGIEGSGKSHHILRISKFFKKRIRFIKMREPGGSINAEKIRKLILNNKSSFSKKTDLLLYSYEKRKFKYIKKNYRKKIILIDRFTDSTIAYQHFGLGVK